MAMMGCNVELVDSLSHEAKHMKVVRVGVRIPCIVGKHPGSVYLDLGGRTDILLLRASSKIEVHGSGVLSDSASG